MSGIQIHLSMHLHPPFTLFQYYLIGTIVYTSVLCSGVNRRGDIAPVTPGVVFYCDLRHSTFQYRVEGSVAEASWKMAFFFFF